MNVARGFRRIVAVLSAITIAAGVGFDASSPTWRVAVRATLGDGRQYVTEELVGRAAPEAIARAVDPATVAANLNRQVPPIEFAPKVLQLFQKLRSEIPEARRFSDEALASRVGPVAGSMRRFRRTFPEYDDIPDVELVRSVITKYPQYRGAFGDVVEGYSFTLCLAQPPFAPFFTLIESFSILLAWISTDRS